MKINLNLFCISLDLHYLCGRIEKQTRKNTEYDEKRNYQFGGLPDGLLHDGKRSGGAEERTAEECVGCIGKKCARDVASSVYSCL